MIIRKAALDESKKVFEIVDELELSHPSLCIENFFVADDGKNIIGVAHVEDCKDCAYLSALGVVFSQRRRGVAKKLVDFAASTLNRDIYAYTLLHDIFSAMGFVISQPSKNIPSREIYNCRESCDLNRCRCMLLKQK